MLSEEIPQIQRMQDVFPGIEIELDKGSKMKSRKVAVKNG
jgi:hypothetical protein